MIARKNIVSILTVLLISFGAANSSSANKESPITIIVSMLLLDDQSTNKVLSISWQRPTQRENNATLNASEIDYYRLRYRLIGAPAYTTLLIANPNTMASITLSGLPGDQYELAIQAVDKNGLASRYTRNSIITFTEADG